MSDTAQGPGWWKASDDKWYPPELHPDAAVRGTAASDPQTDVPATVSTPVAAASGVSRADETAADTPGRGIAARTVLLVAVAAFGLGGLTGFGASRLTNDDGQQQTASAGEEAADVARQAAADSPNPLAPKIVDGATARASDGRAESDLRRALTAAKTLAADWEGRWSAGASDMPIDHQALSREDSGVAFAGPGEAAPGVVSVRVESVDAPNSDLWLASGSTTGTFRCIHSTSAGAVFFGEGTSEDEALAKCVNESW